VFGRGRSKDDSLGYTKVQTIIGEGTAIKGSINSNGVMRIDGTLEGTIEHLGQLVIGPKGRLLANVKAESMAIAGEVRGDVIVKDKLELLSTARLFGDVRCGQLIVHPGAVFQGQSRMAHDEKPELLNSGTTDGAA
jgi:cytoskeletal protein CcmA (bactofilin family)